MVFLKLKILQKIKSKSLKEKELDKNCTKSKHVFVRSDLMAGVMKNSRGEKKIDDFRSKLGFKLPNIKMKKKEKRTSNNKNSKNIFKLNHATTTLF